jgi:hypothetical protein
VAGALALQDVLQDVEADAAQEGIGRLTIQGDLILGRIVRSSNPPHFSWAAVALPGESEAGLADFVCRAYKRHLETHIDASWPQFLSEHGYAFNHYLLRQAAEAGAVQNAAERHYDAWKTVEALREAEKHIREQAAKGLMAQEGAEKSRRHKAGDSLRQTQGGILLPGHIQYSRSREIGTSRQRKTDRGS